MPKLIFILHFPLLGTVKNALSVHMFDYFSSLLSVFFGIQLKMISHL